MAAVRAPAPLEEPTAVDAEPAVLAEHVQRGRQLLQQLVGAALALGDAAHQQLDPYQVGAVAEPPERLLPFHGAWPHGRCHGGRGLLRGVQQAEQLVAQGVLGFGRVCGRVPGGTAGVVAAALPRLAHRLPLPQAQVPAGDGLDVEDDLGEFAQIRLDVGDRVDQRLERVRRQWDLAQSGGRLAAKDELGPHRVQSPLLLGRPSAGLLLEIDALPGHLGRQGCRLLLRLTGLRLGLELLLELLVLLVQPVLRGVRVVGRRGLGDGDFLEAGVLEERHRLRRGLHRVLQRYGAVRPEPHSHPPGCRRRPAGALAGCPQQQRALAPDVLRARREAPGRRQGEAGPLGQGPAGQYLVDQPGGDGRRDEEDQEEARVVLAPGPGVGEPGQDLARHVKGGLEPGGVWPFIGWAPIRCWRG